MNIEQFKAAAVHDALAERKLLDGSRTLSVAERREQMDRELEEARASYNAEASAMRREAEEAELAATLAESGALSRTRDRQCSLQIQDQCRVLDLRGNQIGDVGCESLANQIQTNSWLERLDLRNNGIRGDGVDALSKALIGPDCRIAELLLGHNAIENSGAAAIAKVIQANCCLTHLDLSHCSVYDKGLSTIASALCQNTRIVALDLSYNNLGNDAGTHLSDTLRTNSTLKCLNLAHTGITQAPTLITALTEALKVNSSITTLWLSTFKNLASGHLELSNRVEEALAAKAALGIAPGELARYYSMFDPDELVSLGVHCPEDLLLVDDQELRRLTSHFKPLQHRLFFETVDCLKDNPVPAVSLDLGLYKWAGEMHLALPVLEKLEEVGMKQPRDLMFGTVAETLEDLCNSLKPIEAVRLRGVITSVICQMTVVQPTGVSWIQSLDWSLEKWASAVRLSDKTLAALVEFGVETPVHMALLEVGEVASIKKALNVMAGAYLAAVVHDCRFRYSRLQIVQTQSKEMEELRRFYSGLVVLASDEMLASGVHCPEDLLLLDNQEVKQLANHFKPLQQRLFQRKVEELQAPKRIAIEASESSVRFQNREAWNELQHFHGDLSLESLEAWADLTLIEESTILKLNAIGVKRPIDLYFLSSEKVDALRTTLKPVESVRFGAVIDAIKDYSKVPTGVSIDLPLHEFAKQVKLSTNTLTELDHIGVVVPKHLALLTEAELEVVSSGLNQKEIIYLNVLIDRYFR